MKYLSALVEAAFCVLSTYIALALGLFALGSDRTVPGFMSATTTRTAAGLTTSLDFRPLGGGVLLVVLFVAFVGLHRAVGHRVARRRPVAPTGRLT